MCSFQRRIFKLNLCDSCAKNHKENLYYKTFVTLWLLKDFVL